MDALKPKSKLKLVHSEQYTKKFKDVKSSLPPVYIDKDIAKNVLDNFDSFYLFLEYSPTSLYPRFVVKDGQKGMDLSEAFVVKHRPGNLEVIGYRRQDDILDASGKLLGKSPTVQKQLELIKFSGSLVKWSWFKIKLKTKALLAKLSSLFSKKSTDT